MGVGSWIAIYFIVWWLCLFAVLPWGVRTQSDADDVIPGTAPSAPIRPNLLKKALITSVVAAIVVGMGYGLISSGMLTLDSFPGPKAPPKF